MGADDEKHYVKSVFTGRYKPHGRLKNTKTFSKSKESQKMRDIILEHNRQYRLITKTKQL